MSIVKQLLKGRAPALSNLFRRIKREIRIRRMREKFTRMYLTNWWGEAESASGAGSSLVQTQAIRSFLPAVVSELGAKSFLDIPCGDLNWMSRVDLAVDEYIGADIVRELIAANRSKYGNSRRRFLCLDISKDPLPRVDVIFSRDCLVHLPFKSALAALGNVKASGASYFLATTFPNLKKNDDIWNIGDWRPLNLELAPFHLPRPMRILNERCPDNGDKSIGVWRVADLK